MRNSVRAVPSFILLLVGAVEAPAFAGTATATSFVQATILARDPAKATLTFLDASGRQRVERMAAEAVASLPGVRPGDEVILSMATEAGRAVVTRVRLSHRAEATPVAATAASPEVVPGSGLPLRRSWPNPYAKSARPQPDRR